MQRDGQEHQLGNQRDRCTRNKHLLVPALVTDGGGVRSWLRLRGTADEGKRPDAGLVSVTCLYVESRDCDQFLSAQQSPVSCFKVITDSDK